MFKECLDSCFLAVMACERCAFELCAKSTEHASCMAACINCADIATMTGRICARGLAEKDIFELCAKYCDKCAAECDKISHQFAVECAEACRKCAEKCRSCQTAC